VVSGLECLRRLRELGIQPQRSLELIAFSDEEGRFGGMFGSQSFAGQITPDTIHRAADPAGQRLEDAMREAGLDPWEALRARRDPETIGAYLELHIEQGPVLLDLDLPLGAVLGTFGVERHAITFRGQAAHSGSTPMDRRRDAFLAAARMSPEIYQIAARSEGGVCTIGSCTTKPGIVTSVVEECRITLDQRHLNADALARMYAEAREASERFAEEGNVEVSWERLWHIPPRPFDPELIDLCDEAIRETCGTSHRLPSGPLHDAAEVAAAGVPTVMMFVQSLHGISHNKIEDTKEEHIVQSVVALDKLADKAIGWILKQQARS